MKCEERKENFEGIFDFEKEIRKGKGVLTEKDGIEYFVEYDQNGNEIKEKRKRTFEGIRLMIGKDKQIYLLSLFLFLQFSWVKIFFYKF